MTLSEHSRVPGYGAVLGALHTLLSCFNSSSVRSIGAFSFLCGGIGPSERSINFSKVIQLGRIEAWSSSSFQEESD